MIAYEYHHLFGKLLPEELYSIFMDRNECVMEDEMWIFRKQKIQPTLLWLWVWLVVNV